MTDYFFDSYALLEIIKGNPAYQKYVGSAITTSKLNVFEVYDALLRDYQEDLAVELLEEFYPFAVDFGLETLYHAGRLKDLKRKQKLSLADCVGYTIAGQLHIKFLTGDKEFATMENVEFVK
jgi:PIN domain nuclease of toxin-antitoxin system